MLRRPAPRQLAILCATLVGSASAALAQEVYVAQNNLVVVQFESAPTVDDWNESTATPGFTEDAYFRWDGPNLFNQPGAAGIFGFDFEVQNGGVYQLRLRNRHENPDPTEENDVWIRMDGGAWVKTFSNMAGSVGAWTWETRFDFAHNNQPNASYTLNPGVHRIEFSGRSFGFKMDSFHLYQPGAPGALNPNTPESPRRFGIDYCTANPNSAGTVSQIDAFGSPEVDDNELLLTVTGLPANQFGIFIVSDTQAFVPGVGGTLANLCIADPGRYSTVVTTGAIGRASLSPDLTALPRPSGFASAQPGSTWHWQFWHRDTLGNANMSRGIAIRLQ